MRRIAMTALAAAAFTAMFVCLTGSAAVAAPVDCVLQTHRGACYEPIWVHGVQVTMTFPQAAHPLPGPRNTNVMNFYVVAPQTDTPQGALPFGHDHVVPAMPGEPEYSVYLQGYLVLCSAEGFTSGACEATIIQYGGATLPLARTVKWTAADLGRPDRTRRARGARHPIQRRATVPRNDRPGQARARPPNQSAVICARARSSNG
jgi:hypothetical protein